MGMQAFACIDNAHLSKFTPADFVAEILAIQEMYLKVELLSTATSCYFSLLFPALALTCMPSSLCQGSYYQGFHSFIMTTSDMFGLN